MKNKNKERSIADRLELALDSAHMGTFEWDIINNKRTWDTNTHKILGTTPESYDGSQEGFLKLIYPEDRDFVKICLNEALKNSSYYETHYRILHPNKTLRYIKARGKVYSKEGIPYLMIGVCWDYTEQALLEKEKDETQQELIHASKLASIGILTASIAHEINNPLTILKGYIDHLSFRLSDEDNQAYVMMQKALRRITTIVSSLKKISRNETSKELHATDVREAVEETLALFSPYFKDNEISISKNDTALTTTFLGDTGELQQVFMNLLSNANDALRSQRHKRIEINLKNIADNIVIEFFDNGSGMTAEAIKNAFQPFFTTKEREKGSGLGLYISQSIIKKFKGDIKIESFPNLGTIFKITLPTLKIEKTTDSLIKKNYNRFKGRSILIVEDEDVIREILKNCLKHFGFDIFEAANGRAALDLLNNNFIDILLTDIYMPQMSGDLLIREIQNTKNNNIKKIILSGYDLQNWPEEKKQVLQGPNTVFLQKPINLNDIVAILEKI